MNPRRVIARTLFAIGLAGLIAGCSTNNDGNGPKGSLAITMGATGAPAADAATAATTAATTTADHDHDDALSRLQAAVITIAGIEARLADGTWVPVETGLPADVDLIAIMNSGNVATLPADLLPEGDYDALELRITQVELTLVDGTRIAITPPGTGWTVQIPVNFSVVAGESTVIKLKLRCGSSFRLIDGEFQFDPEFEVDGVERD